MVKGKPRHRWIVYPIGSSLLREVRYNGLFDVSAKGLANLHTAMQRVLEREDYVNPTFALQVKRTKNITLDALTGKEEMVLSVIGDGSEDQQAGDRLGLSPVTINTHRKAIMGKLKLHQKSQLMCYAVQNGYVEISPDGGLSSRFSEETSQAYRRKEWFGEGGRLKAESRRERRLSGSAIGFCGWAQWQRYRLTS